MNPYDVSFDLDKIRGRYAKFAASTDEYQWSFDPFVLQRFRTEVNELSVREESAELLEDKALSSAEEAAV